MMTPPCTPRRHPAHHRCRDQSGNWSHLRGYIPGTGLGLVQEDKFGVVIGSALDLRETLWRLECPSGFLHDDQRVGREPAAGAGADERLFGQSLSIRRIEENKRER